MAAQKSASIFSLLKEDHREVKNLSKQIQGTTERGLKKREKLFEKFRTELLAHAKAEEAVFYNRIKDETEGKGGKLEETRDTILEGFEEHHVAELLLTELSRLSYEDERWLPKFKVLSEALEHHIEEEEEEMFAEARKLFELSELRSIGDEFEMRKQQNLSPAGRAKIFVMTQFKKTA